jgi:hypothetical protein
MLTNLVAEHSIALMGESMAMEERAVEEVLGFKVTAVDPGQLTGCRDAQGVDTVFFNGKPVMQMWPPEVVTETLEDRIVLRMTRRWRKL